MVDPTQNDKSLLTVILSSLQCALAGVIALILGALLSELLLSSTYPEVSGLWCSLVAIYILKTQQEPLLMITIKSIGSILLGTILAILTFRFIGYYWVTLAIALWVAVIICRLLYIDRWDALAALAIVVCYIIGRNTGQENAINNGVYRFIEAMLGVAISISMVFLLQFVISKTNEKKAVKNSHDIPSNEDEHL